MLDSYELETLEQVKAISDPLRIKILFEILEEAKTGKMIAVILQMSAPKIHYHLRELEKNRLIKVERTAEKNGIIQKFYRPVAYRLHIKDDFLTPDIKLGDAMEESYRQICKYQNKMKESAEAGNIRLDTDVKRVVLTSEQHEQVMEKLAELETMIKGFTQTETDKGKGYLMQYFLYPFDHQEKFEGGK